MIEFLILWFVFFFLSFGVLGLHFILMRKEAGKPWNLRIDKNYVPKVSILIPTFNESEIIHFKLINVSKVEYPREQFQVIIVDSNSDDGTIGIVNDFVMQHPEINFKVLVENQRKGKSAALNFALKHCDGDVVVVSDADCFWPQDILLKALPFLAEPSVGAISGPKILLNADQSWVAKTEDSYLDSMNLMKLGESKKGSTMFFEGGFSAYKREALESFDPYNTGSDDCGTVIGLIEKGFRTILVPEAKFYSSFPVSWKEKVSLKIRRCNQLVRVFGRLTFLLLKGRIKISKGVVMQGILTYVIGPLSFVGLVFVTVFLLLSFPYLALVFLVFLIPKVRLYVLEVINNYVLLFLSILLGIFGKKFTVWNKPKDRFLLREDTLLRYGLI